MLPCAEHVLSCRMCEGEKRKLVIPSELGKRSFLSQDGVWGICLGKGEGWFSLCMSPPIHSLQFIPLPSLAVSSNEDRTRPLGPSALIPTLCLAFHSPSPFILPLNFWPRLRPAEAWLWPGCLQNLCLATAHFVSLHLDRVWRAGSPPKDSR